MASVFEAFETTRYRKSLDMAPQKRTQFNVASDSPAWAGDENNADINDSRGSQGSVDHIVKDMANALNESVNPNAEGIC